MRNPTRSRLRKQIRHIETLEKRQLLAADLVVDAPDKDVELQIVGELVQVLDRADNSVIAESEVDEITDKVEITSRSFRADSPIALDGNSLFVFSNEVNLLQSEIITTDFEDTEDAGELYFEASTINMLAGSKLDSQTIENSARQAGRITLKAVDRISPAERFFQETAIPTVGDIRSSKIDVVDSFILGRDIKIEATGDTASRWDSVASFQDSIATEVINALQQAPQIAMSAISPLSGQVKIHDAASSILIENTTIDSSSSIDLGATAMADSSVNALAINGLNRKFMGSVGFSKSASSAVVELTGSETILDAATWIDIDTNASSKAEVKTRSEGGSQVSAGAVDKAFNLGLAFTKETSIIDVGQFVQINAGGRVDLDAQGTVVNKVKADTALFQDGTAAFSVAVGVDEATIRADVAGTILSGDTSELRTVPFSGSDINPNTNQIRLVVPASTPLRTGERVIYQPTNSAETGLVEQVEYIVSEATDPVAETAGNVSQFVRLVRAESLSLDARQVPEASQHTLGKLAIAEFPITAITAESGTGDGLIEISLPADVDQVTYLGPDNPAEESDDAPAGIDGLEQNARYEVVRFGPRIKLRSIETGEFLDFEAPESGPNHGFHYEEATFQFSPRVAVDREANTIELPADHGLKTGDVLIYSVDHTRSIDREVASFDENGNRTGKLGDVTLPDAPIRGMQNNLAYRVIVDAHDPTKVRLGSSYANAIFAQTADLKSASGSGFEFLRFLEGIRVNAHLNATNFAEAGVNLTNGKQPWTAVVSGVTDGNVDDVAQTGFLLVDQLRKAVSMDGRALDNAQKSTGAKTKSNSDIAGTVAVAHFDHEVETKIASSAVLKSKSSLSVDANIKQQTRLGVTSESTRNALNETSDDDEYAVGIGVGIYNNKARAIVDDFAKIDASRWINVDASVSYPLLLDGNSDGNLNIDELGLFGFKAFKDGTHGLSSLFNVYSRTLADGGDKDPNNDNLRKVLALGGGFALTFTTNEVLAQVGSNAEVNQDVNYALPGQTVNVTSELEASVIEVGQMMSVNISIPGFLEALTKQKKNPGLGNFATDLLNPLGVSGDNAFGGTLLVNTTNNSTIAEIESGAKVSAASLDVKAESDFYDFAGVQTGTGSTEAGFSAAIAASNLASNTQARIHEDAIVTVDTLDVVALDELDRITYAGAILKGKQTGIGTSIGVNVVDQRVAAFVGREETSTALKAPAEKTLTVDGRANINATARGSVESYVISGALQGLGKSTADAKSKQSGPIAFTVPVAYNSVTTDVDAYLDSQRAEVGSLDVEAEAALETKNLAIGGSFAIQSGAGANAGKLDLAGVGAASINFTDQQVDAFVVNAHVTSAGDVNVEAIEASSVEADAGGLAVAFGSGPNKGVSLSFGVSLAINDVNGNTNAKLNNTEFVFAGNGNLTVDAASLAEHEEDSEQGSSVRGLALAGAVSASTGNKLGSFGGTGAAVQNWVDKSVRAEIFSSTIETGLQNIHVTSRDETQVIADAGGLSLSGGTATKINGAVGIGLSFNEVVGSTIARIDDATINAAGEVLVQANLPPDENADTAASINALSFAATAAVAGSKGLSLSLAGAGAGSNNQVRKEITAEVFDSTVESTASSVKVQAFDNTSIVATTVGASLNAGFATGLSGTLALGLSIARNEIDNTVTAKVGEGSVTADIESENGIVAVKAQDDTSIKATSVAASLAVSAARGLAISLSGGGAEASNIILSDLHSLVEETSIVANALDMDAKSKSTIESGVYGTFAGGAGSAAPAGSAAIGASVANNFVGYELDGTKEDAKVEAKASRSNLTTQKIHIDSDSTQDIDATTFVGAFTLVGSVGAAVSGAGAGSKTTNKIGTAVDAILEGSESTIVSASTSTNLKAKDDSDITATTTAITVAAAVSGAAGGAVEIGIALAENSIDNRVEALLSEVDFAETNQGSVKVESEQISYIDSSSVATSVSGAATAGLAAAIAASGASSVNEISNKTLATVTNSDITTSELTVDAVNRGTIHSEIRSATVAAGLSVANGGGLAVGVSDAHNVIGDSTSNRSNPSRAAQVIASIDQASEVTSSGGITVTANNYDTVTSDTTSTVVSAAGSKGVSLSAAAAGVGAYNTLASEIAATIGGETSTQPKAKIDATKDILVSARDESTVSSDVGSVAVSAVVGTYGGGVSLAISKAETEFRHKIDASISQATVTASKDVNVRAVDDAEVDTVAYATAIGATLAKGFNITGGGAIAFGSITPEVEASLSASEVTAIGNVKVESDVFADSDSDTKANTVSVLGIAAAGSVPTAIVKPTSRAIVSDSEISSGRLDIHADFQPLATADAAGLSIAVGASVGASDATVDVAGTVEATLGSRFQPVEVDTLEILADARPLEIGFHSVASFATANASGGGVLLGTNSAYSESIDSSSVTAKIDNVSNSIEVAGSAKVKATSNNLQRAESDAYSGGVVGAGVPTSIVENNLTTKALLGNGVVIIGESLEVSANGRSDTLSDAQAGTGGVVAGSITQSKTDNRSTTEASIGDNSSIDFDSITFDADFTTQFNAKLSAVAGGVLSGQGGFVYNDVASTVASKVGENTFVGAPSIDIDANNFVVKPDLGDAGNVDVTTGGLITGGGVGSHTTLSLTTSVDIAKDSRLIADGGSEASIDLQARNEFDITNRLTARAGGVGAQAHVDSSIVAIDSSSNGTTKYGMHARVKIADDARLSSSGTIDVSTIGTGDATIQANSAAAGVATIGSGTSEITLHPRNEIQLSSGAKIEAQSDVNFTSGVNTFDEANYELESRMDTFGGSLIPLEFIDSISTVLEKNRINVAAESVVESGANIGLHAEQYGFNNTDAIAKAVNWVSGLDSAISGLDAEGGVEQTKGTAVSAAFGAVTVDGTVRTGIGRHRDLHITDVNLDPNGNAESADSYDVVLNDETANNIPFTKRLEEVQSSLHIDLDNAKRQLARFDDDQTLRRFYESEVVRLQDALREQGLFSKPTNVHQNNNSVVREQASEQNALVVTIDDLVAQAGKIEVSGDRFVGGGNLDAPGDASITITNDSLAHIELSGVVIPDVNGGVNYNHNRVSEVGGGNRERILGEIASENSRNVEPWFVLEPESLRTPAFTEVIGGVGAPEPAIRVSNTILTSTEDGFKYPWPNIQVVEDPIQNLGGSVTLELSSQSEGAILIKAPVTAESQQITAGRGTTSISVPGVNSIYEVGGTEYAEIHKKLYTAHTHKGIVKLETPGQNSNAGFTRYLAEVPTEVSLEANRIFVEAHYINVNGLIQSGKADYSLSIDESVATEVNNYPPQSRVGIVTLETQPSDDFALQYDFDRERLLISELTVSGGYVELTGNIANTRQGEIRVFSAYADVKIDNQTGLDIELSRIDVSRRGEGKVIINDLGRGNGTTPEVTHYIRHGDTVEQTRYLRTGQTTYQHSAHNDTTFYIPAEGLRYGWTVAEDSSRITRKTYRSSSWLGAIDALAKDGEEVSSFGPKTLSSEVAGSGAYFHSSGGLRLPRYIYSKSTVNTSQSPWRLTHEWTEWTGAFLWAVENHYSSWVRTSKNLTLHRHSIAADRPIDIKFLGHDEGNIDIQSEGKVFIAGRVSNPTGRVYVTSNSGVYQSGEAGVLQGKVTAFFGNGETYGEPNSPLHIDQVFLPHDYLSTDTVTIYGGQRVAVMDGNDVTAMYEFTRTKAEGIVPAEDLLANPSRWDEISGSLYTPATGTSYGLFSNDKPLYVKELVGDFRGGTLHAGLVSVVAEGDILDYGYGAASSLTHEAYLRSENGDISFNVSSWESVPTVSAWAPGDIYLHSPDSTLALGTIQAGGHVTLETAQRVIDANEVSQRDTRAESQIVAAVWGDLQLTEELGASTKQQERIEAFESRKTNDYHAYWRFRKTQQDPSVYDPDHRVRVNGEERDYYEDEGYSEEEITTIENNRTQLYHELHPEVGELTNEYDADYQYQASVEERDEVPQDKVWTREELTSLSRPYGVKGVSDTEFEIEEPNVIGLSVTINAAKGIGGFQNGSVIDLQTGDDAELSLRDRAMIAAAEPDDIFYLSAPPIVIPDVSMGQYLSLLERTKTWLEYGITIGDELHIQSGSHSPEGILVKVLTVSEDGFELEIDKRLLQDAPVAFELTVSKVITDPDLEDQATHLLVQRREDIDINSPGLVTAISDYNIFLGSEGDLQLNQIHSGSETYEARLEIRAAGDLVDAAEDKSVPNLIGGRVVLESGDESIGATDAPLRLGLTENHTLIARADDHVVLEQSGEDQNGHLRINEVFSRKEPVHLTADGHIRDAFDSDATNIQAPGIILTSLESIGELGNLLDINLTGTGTITANAVGDVRLLETVGDMRVRQVTAGAAIGNTLPRVPADVELVAELSIIDSIDVENATDPNSPDADQVIGLPRVDISGHNVSLTATGGAVGQPGNEIDLNTGYRSGAEEGALFTFSEASSYVMETTGDLYLGRIESDEDTAFIVAPRGSIYSGLDRFEENVLGGKLWVFALNDIGTRDFPIESSASAIEGEATTGSVFIQQDVPLEIGGVVGDASEGEDSSFTDGFSAGQDLTIWGDKLHLPERIEVEGEVLLWFREEFVMPGGTSISADAKVTVFSADIRIEEGAAIASDTRITLQGFPKDENSGANINVGGSLLSRGIVSIRGSQQDDVVHADLEETMEGGGQIIYSGLGGDDNITGSRFAEIFIGDDGQDIIDSGNGCDVILGGEGFDTYLNVEACDHIGTLTGTTEGIDEDVPVGTVVGTLAMDDLDEEDSLSFRIVEEDSPFAVLGNDLVVANQARLNRKANTNIPVTVAADHAQGGTTIETFHVEVTADNEAPFGITLSNQSVAENAPGAVIGGFGFADPDVDDSHTIVLTDSRFEIVEGQLKLLDDVSLNHETEPTIDLGITVTDEAGLSTTEDFVLQVIDADDPPTGIDLRDVLLLENLKGMVLGSLEVLDEDGGSLFDFAADDERFDIEGNILRLKPNIHLSVEAEPLLTLAITATDASNELVKITNTFEFQVQANPAAWQNWASTLDVNQDGSISPIDALIVINALNSNSIQASIPLLAGGQLPGTREFESTQPFLDTNGDLFLSPIDALLVITHLNNGGGEGEARLEELHDQFFSLYLEDEET